MPFFVDFDKKTLRVVVERLKCIDFKRDMII